MANETELILKAKSGNDTAMDELVSIYMTYAKEKAKGYVSSGIEYDDLVQEAMIGFLSAYYTFDTHGKASFKTYVGVCMDNRILTAINALNRKKRIPLSAIVSIDEVLLHDTVTATDPEKYFIIREQIKSVMELIESELSDFEKKVLYLSLDGNSYEQIAEKTKTTLKSVDNALQRVRRKLKNC